MSDALMMSILIPVIAIVLDSVIGDPYNFPHPVRYIGNTLDFIESKVRLHLRNLWLAGVFTLLLLCALSWGVITLLVSIPIIGMLFGIYFSYAGLALGCLLKEGRHVGDLVEQGHLEEARRALSMLVSRDTANMNEDEIRRSLAETISENLNDGFIAPLFYLVLTGPAGLWVYKTVSTMDSMWGYKNDRFEQLGYAGAKIDDVLAFIPARLTAWAMYFAGKLMSLDTLNAKKHFKVDARKMESPNAGWPMSMAAWLIGGQMGGETMYFGEAKNKPILGPLNEKWHSFKINQLIDLCKRTALVASIGLILAKVVLSLVFFDNY